MCIALLLFMEYCIAVWATSRLHTPTIQKYRTIGTIGTPTLSVNPFIRGSTLLTQCRTTRGQFEWMWKRGVVAWFTVLPRNVSTEMTKNHETLLVSIDCVPGDIQIGYHYRSNQHNRRITNEKKNPHWKFKGLYASTINVLLKPPNAHWK